MNPIKINAPNCCLICGKNKFHKTESRTQKFKDLVNGFEIELLITRQRYRCVFCFTKVWDHVEGACSYRRKTFALLSHTEKIDGL